MSAAFAILLPILQKAGAPILKSIIQKNVRGKAGKVATDVIDVLAGQIGTEATPEAIVEAHKAEPERIETIIKQVEIDHGPYLELLAADAKSENVWIAGWRPFNGYLFGAACFITIMTVCIVVGFQIPLTENALTLAAMVGPTIVAWSGVIGAYVYNRTQEKKAGVS